MATAGDFPFAGKIVEIPSTATIEQGLATLTSHGLLSAPVWDPKAKKYLGFFDISDVLALVYGVDLLRHLFPVQQLKDQTQVDVHGLKLDLTQSTDARGVDLPVSSMMQVEGRTAPWWPVSSKSKLLDVVKRLAAKVDPPWSPCRRVPVVDAKSGKVVKIISQSEMVNRVFSNVVESKSLEPMFIETPRTHGMGLCKLFTVHGTSDTARTAFELIINHRVSAVPVVDDSGAMTACITNKDIFTLQRMREKGGSSDKTPDELSAQAFVDLARAYCTKHKVFRQEPVSVTVDTPIHVIIKELAERKTHRVFLVDKPGGPPVGVVSVSDIIKLILDDGMPWPQNVMVKHMTDKS